MTLGKVLWCCLSSFKSIRSFHMVGRWQCPAQLNGMRNLTALSLRHWCGDLFHDPKMRLLPSHGLPSVTHLFAEFRGSNVDFGAYF